MSNRISIKENIKKLVKEYFEEGKEEKFVPGKSKIPLSAPSFQWEEVFEAIDSLLSTYLTMGKKVRSFEKTFSNYIGIKDSVMVNSGSSANLLALSVLSNPMVGNERIMPEDEVIVPAVTWSTTVFPIVNIGAVPVLVDVNLDTFDIKVDEIQKAISDKTKAIMPVHLLGFPADMDNITRIAKESNLYTIEDACEAHGAELHGKKVGSFGHMGTFSFFFSHHITTIEGGMITTDVKEYVELLKTLRAHGWIREREDRKDIAEKYRDLIDDRFLFINIGFNVRPTEIQGAFGIHQIKKLENFIKIRRENAKYWTERLQKYSDYLILHKEKKYTRAVWFGYPLTVKPNAPFTRNELIRYLETKGIETRPIMAGSMADQPAMQIFKHKTIGDLHNSRLIMRNSFFFGNHHGIGESQREYIADCIEHFIKERKAT